jgi:glucose repression mediator protein
MRHPGRKMVHHQQRLIGPLTRVCTSPSVLLQEADLIDYDDGANAVDALMTLHGDRPSGGESDGSSPGPASGAGTNKRSATSPKVESVQAVKRAKNGSDSPATRTVIEVLNTPNVASPVPRTEAASNGEGYFKGAQIPKPESNNGAQPVSSETETKESAPTPAVEVPPQTEPVKATEDRPPTPPSEPVAAPPAAAVEDVTMAEPEQSAPVVEAIAPAPAPTAPQSTETAEAVQRPAQLEAASADKPTAVPDAKEKDMEVDAPEIGRPTTPDLPPPPPAAEPSAVEPMVAAPEIETAPLAPVAAETPVEGDKKDE